MKFFESKSDCLSYVLSVLLLSLEDDLNLMETSEREHHTDDDREDMQKRINDIREIEPDTFIAI